MNKNISKRNYDFFKKAEFLKFASTAAEAANIFLRTIDNLDFDKIIKGVGSSARAIKGTPLDNLLVASSLKSSAESMSKIITAIKNKDPNISQILASNGLDAQDIISYSKFLQEFSDVAKGTKKYADFIRSINIIAPNLNKIRDSLIKSSRELDLMPSQVPRISGPSSARQVTQNIGPSQISASTSTSAEILQIARVSNVPRLTASQAVKIPRFTQDIDNAVRGGNVAVDRSAADVIVGIPSANTGINNVVRVAASEVSEATNGSVSLVVVRPGGLIDEAANAADIAGTGNSLALRQGRTIHPVTQAGTIDPANAIPATVAADGSMAVRQSQSASPGAATSGATGATSGARAGTQAPTGSPPAAAGGGSLGGGGGGIGGSTGAGAAANASSSAGGSSIANATNRLRALFKKTPTVTDILYSLAVLSSIAFGAAAVYGAYLLFSDEEKQKSSDAIDRAIACLKNIPVNPGSEVIILKRSIISRLSYLKESINQNSEESGKLISEIFAENGLIPNFIGMVAAGDNVDINDSYTMEDLSRDIACITDASSGIIGSAELSNFTESSGQNEPRKTRDSSGPSVNYPDVNKGEQPASVSKVTANSIIANVTLSTGETYQVPISTKKPSIPQRFILYLANGRGPDNFFASPTFAAFVDPDMSSPIGGSGLVPNAIGSQNIEDRIASAIKYCYNNDIDSATELRRFMIRQINSGVGFLKKLFTNEPEQRVLDRAIGFYASGSASGVDVSEPLSRREVREDRRERRRVDRANRRASDFSDNIIKNSQKNNQSINKEDSAMNKLAQNKNKVDAYEYAVKGLEDSLTKAYYAGLNSMYNEKPKDKKKDLKDLYNIDEEGGIKAIQSAHPKSVYVGESMGDGSLIENSLEQQYKTEQKLLPTPTGNFTSKNAFFQHLYKLRKVAKDAGKKEAFELINNTINKLEKI